PGASAGGDYMDMLFRDPAPAAATWTTTLAPQSLAVGQGLVTARADWSYNSTWLAFQLGNMIDADHQTNSPGQLQIQRGGDDLLINTNALGGPLDPHDHSANANLVVINDNGDGNQTYPYNMGVWYGTPGGVMTNYEAAANYVYAGGDYAAAYSPVTNPGSGGPATQLTRQIVYLRPDYISVHDRVGTLKASYPKLLSWNFLNAPQASGNSWTE